MLWRRRRPSRLFRRSSVTYTSSALPPNWQRGFWALIVTQFQNAFNDNAIKFLVIYIIVAMNFPEGQRDFLVLVVGALFALPFIFFSMTGGYFADRYSKRSVVVGTKLMEILVMAVAIAGLAMRSLPMECAAVFLISTQSALFGPSKYGSLPELLPEQRLSWGNGIIELGTFLGSISAVMAAGFLAAHYRGRPEDVGRDSSGMHAHWAGYEFFFRWTEFVPYFQDTWRVRPTVTLNLGLGWNMSTPPNAVGSDAAYPHAFDFQTGQVKFAALGQISPEVYSIDLNNFAPRVGVAWQPSFLDGTVIRAGAGIYYPAENALYNLFAITAPGVSIVQSITNNPSQPMPTYLLGQNVFPPVSQVPITPEFASNIKGVLFALDTKLRTPYIQQWSMAVQHMFGKGTLAEIDYIGSQSRKLPIRYNADDCSVVGSLACDQNARPYPQFPYLYMAANEGTASYNAAVAKFQTQVSRSLSFVANYTWSKALSNTQQGGAPVGLNERGVCLSCDKGLAGFNVPQRLVASGVWDLPLGKGKKYLNGGSPTMNYLLGGWTLNTIATFSKGNPFTVLAATSTSMDPMTNFRPNRLCNGRYSLTNQDVRSNGLYWFDPSCFAKPAPNYFGDSGTNIITGPGINNWDMGIGKVFPIREAMDLQFRTELFNAFNHTQFLNPDSTMTDSTFGRITTARPARELQFGLKLLW